MDNPRTRALCRKCPARLDCATDALQQIRLGLHPTGIRAGIWMPDDKRADGAKSSPARLFAIQQLRSIVAVLSRMKSTIL